jgi:hypothetical protein
MKEYLIRTSVVALGPHNFVFEALFPGRLPNLSHILPNEFGPPSGTHNCIVVQFMVSHKVEIFVGIKPFLNGGLLPVRKHTVQVSGDVKINLHKKSDVVKNYFVKMPIKNSRNSIWSEISSH